MITEIIDGEKIQEVKKYINEGESFVIVTHVAPDGDALGSSLGLYHFLKKHGKENVKVVVPNDFPSFYNWMPGAKDIVIYDKNVQLAERYLKNANVVLCLDFNAAKRVDRLAPAVLEAEGRKVLIDHHLGPDLPCQVVISHPDMSSTSELIFRFLCQMGMSDKITKDVATCIYTGMMTDTGSFTYNSNDPEIYLIIGELIKKGIDKDQIYRNVYQVYSVDRLHMQGYVLYRNMKIYPKYHTALIVLSGRELNYFHYQTGDTEGFVNLPLSIKGITFSCFIRRNKNHTKISLRSVGDFPCNVFASRYFNGGGHKNASGGEFSGSVSEAVEVFEKGLSEFNPNNIEEIENPA